MANTKNHINTPLTQEVLQAYIGYDINGTFEWQSGKDAGKQINTAAKRKPQLLYTQDMDNLPVKPRNHKPQHVGYVRISEKRYNDVLSGKYDVDVGLKYSEKKKDYTRQFKRLRQVYARHYKMRVKSPKGSHEYEVCTYYLMDNLNTYPRITVLGKSYNIPCIAYLYMGYPLEPYDPLTGKKYKIPCRDGNHLNFAWDNIKPDEHHTLVDGKPVMQEVYRPLTVDVYRLEDCMSSHYDTYKTTVATKTIYSDTYEDAVVEFNKLTAQLNGKKYRIRANTVRVERVEGSHYYKRGKQS
jgi:hypothetical protein